MVDGEDIYAPGYRRSRLCERMGVLFQYPEKQLFETTVEREVSFALRHTDLTMAERRERVCRALELVGFDYQKVAGAVAAWLFRRGETAAGHCGSAGGPSGDFAFR